MKPFKNRCISRLLILNLLLASLLTNTTYARDLHRYTCQTANNHISRGMTERPEDFLKDREKAEAWERKEAERIEKTLERPERKALESYKKDSVELTKYSQTRNYFYDYQIEHDFTTF